MSVLSVNLQGDGAFRDLAERHGPAIHLSDGAEIRVAGLEAGMTSGKPSVALGFVLPDGRWVLAETSLALFLTAAEMLMARFGDPRS